MSKIIILQLVHTHTCKKEIVKILVIYIESDSLANAIDFIL